MGLSRHEVNLRRLLVKCELMIKNKQHYDERFPKYVSSLCDMLQELKTTADSDNIQDYTRRIDHIKKSTNNVTTTTTIQSDELNNKSMSSREELLGPESNIRFRPNATTDDLNEVLDYHKNMQDKIAEEMLKLTSNLKEQSKIANRIIKQDTEVISKSSNITERNFSKLKVESEKLDEHSKRACKCWMWVMLIIVMVLFINMVLFMKVMKKKL